MSTTSSALSASSVQAESALPSSTATERRGSQWRLSRSQVSFMLAGQTTTAGKAASASSAASACTVLPSPCSSAMKLRRRSSA